MAFQEVTKMSYGSRLGNSLRGIIAGLVLFIAATALLWWNEGRAVKTSKMLKDSAKECVDVADVSSVDPALNGKLIHATAVAQTDEILTDPDYGISVNAIRLVRNVEYYQWVEESESDSKDKIGGGQETVTTYSYSRQWVDSPVDSDEFSDPDYKGSNTVRVNVEDKTVTADKVSFGGYVLPKSMVGSIPAATTVNLSQSPANGVDVFVVNNFIYYGENPDTPAVGDVRVSFLQADGGDASILAKVNGNTFEPYVHKNGKSLCVLSMGVHSMDEMYESQRVANKFLSWIFRILGLLLVIAALRSMFSIVVAILKVLPFLGNVAQVGVNLVTGIVGTIWTLLVILVAWVVWRPALAIVLAVAICLLVGFLIYKSKTAPAPAPETAPAAPQAPKTDA
ncbi:MAG: TMEM43 family protein [Bacteroidales bacterium]|nr:TMEM43 family protein [Bacteroidales bacterium]